MSISADQLKKRLDQKASLSQTRPGRHEIGCAANGELRRVIVQKVTVLEKGERERYGIVWRCSLCGGMNEELEEEPIFEAQEV